MRSLIIFLLLLLAVVCLGVASCRKEHKSYGGSSSSGGVESESTRGSGLFGGGVPSEPGDYVDVGNGWVRMTMEQSLTSKDPSQLSPDQALTVSGDTVRYGWRLTPTEKQDSYTPNLTTWISLYPLSVERSQRISGSDRSDYGAGYVLWEFKLPPVSGQYYELGGAKPPGFRYYALLYQP
jgi:hypothetical protein